MRWLVPVCLLPLLTFGFAAFVRPDEPRRDTAPTVAARVTNAAEMRQRLGLTREYDKVPIEAVKVAVLDYGFNGVGSSRRYLPDNTVVVEHYDPGFVRRFNLG